MPTVATGLPMSLKLSARAGRGVHTAILVSRVNSPPMSALNAADSLPSSTRAW